MAASPIPVSAQWENWLRLRQACRTNLVSLCWELGHKDVDVAVHGQMVVRLQQFKGGTDSPRVGKEKFSATHLVTEYKPLVPNLYDLEGPRDLLILIARGHLKSTICTEAHTIQWILNYPNVRVRLHAAKNSQVEGFLRNIRNMFMYNERFRQLFPEFCPRQTKSGKVDDFGNLEGFDTPARYVYAKERTVSISSSESVISSTHHEVLTVDDLVDDTNSQTPGEIDRIERNFGMLDPLVERGKDSRGRPAHGWRNLVGTIYSFSDLHYKTWQAELAKPWVAKCKCGKIYSVPGKPIEQTCSEVLKGIICGRDLEFKTDRTWTLYVRSAAPNYPNGPVMWPARWPIEELRAIEADSTRGPRILYPQYLMQPKTDQQGLVAERDDIRWMPRDKFKEYYAFINPNVTIDCAGMETEVDGQDRDNTCVNCHGFGADGKLYVFELLYSRNVTPEDVISYLFWLYDKHPRIGLFKMEKENHARILMPWLKKEMAVRGVRLPVDFIERDTKVSKYQRNLSLQPWLRNRQIIHVEGLGFTHPRTGEWHDVKKPIEDELLFFPRYNKRDYLDTLGDAMQGRDGRIISDIIPRETLPLDINPWKLAGTVNGETRWKHYGSFPVAMAEQLWRQEMEGEEASSTEVID